MQCSYLCQIQGRLSSKRSGYTDKKEVLNYNMVKRSLKLNHESWDHVAILCTISFNLSTTKHADLERSRPSRQCCPEENEFQKAKFIALDHLLLLSWQMFTIQMSICLLWFLLLVSHVESVAILESDLMDTIAVWSNWFGHFLSPETLSRLIKRIRVFPINCTRYNRNKPE